jgi:hypothetical protein
MEYLSYIVLALIAGWIGWHIRGIVVIANLSVNPDKMIKMLEEIKKLNLEEAKASPAKDTGVECVAEQVNGSWYAYIKDTNQFIGQGSSIEAALEQAADRFPSKVFWCKKPEEYNQTT